MLPAIGIGSSVRRRVELHGEVLMQRLVTEGVGEVSLVKKGLRVAVDE